MPDPLSRRLPPHMEVIEEMFREVGRFGYTHRELSQWAEMDTAISSSRMSLLERQHWLVRKYLRGALAQRDGCRVLVHRKRATALEKQKHAERAVGRGWR